MIPSGLIDICPICGQKKRLIDSEFELEQEPVCEECWLTI